jgi:hypothetical protein
MFPAGQGGAGGGPDPERAELVEGEDSVGEAVQHFLDPVPLRLSLGVGDSFQVLARWKVIPQRASRQRKASRPMRMTRPWTSRR